VLQNFLFQRVLVKVLEGVLVSKKYQIAATLESASKVMSIIYVVIFVFSMQLFALWTLNNCKSERQG